MENRETFLQIQLRPLQHLIPKNCIHGVQEEQNRFTHQRRRKIENRTPVQDQRCKSGPSAKKSVIPSEGESLNNYGADQQRLQISDLHATPATFACWKIRFKTEVCTCSQFPTEATHWIKEVEMVESVDDLKTSRSITGTHGPKFEVLDAKITSALNRIVHISHFKRRISLEEQKAQKQRTVSFAEDRSLT